MQANREVKVTTFEMFCYSGTTVLWKQKILLFADKSVSSMQTMGNC